jgi:4-amino-4-deoxy-L-arabinose transferase-like glycosyltransferase
MTVFGPGNFGFKFPSILAALLALYATYRLARRLYDENTGRLAALVLGTCQGLFLMTNDIRTDTLLMAFVVTSLWAISEAAERRKWYWVLLGTAAIACGMMTKGPIALFVPLFAFGAHWVLRREWRKLFSPWHLLDAALIAALLIPMCIGLYQQFDVHPEKAVNGTTGLSGLRFFFWTQSFGRITGENQWANGAGPEFLASNMLWSFLPWMTLLIPALVVNVITLFRQRLRLNARQEWVSTGGFLLTYASLALSKYQLPHYIFVVFPLAAIIVAAFLKESFEGHRVASMKVLRPLQVVIAALTWVGVLLILTLVFPVSWLGLALWAMAVITWLVITLRSPRGQKFFWACVAAMVGINLFLTHHFYPELLRYQAGSVAGRYFRQYAPHGSRLFAHRVDDPLNALHFYARRVAPSWDSTSALSKNDWILTQGAGLATLRQRGAVLDTVLSGRRFKVSELTLPFLEQRTRSAVTQPYYLVRVRE